MCTRSLVGLVIYIIQFDHHSLLYSGLPSSFMPYLQHACDNHRSWQVCGQIWISTSNQKVLSGWSVPFHPLDKLLVCYASSEWTQLWSWLQWSWTNSTLNLTYMYATTLKDVDFWPKLSTRMLAYKHLFQLSVLQPSLTCCSFGIEGKVQSCLWFTGSGHLPRYNNAESAHWPRMTSLI